MVTTSCSSARASPAAGLRQEVRHRRIGHPGLRWGDHDGQRQPPRSGRQRDDQRDRHRRVDGQRHHRWRVFVQAYNSQFQLVSSGCADPMGSYSWCGSRPSRHLQAQHRGSIRQLLHDSVLPERNRPLQRYTCEPGRTRCDSCARRQAGRRPAAGGWESRGRFQVQVWTADQSRTAAWGFTSTERHVVDTCVPRGHIQGPVHKVRQHNRPVGLRRIDQYGSRSDRCRCRDIHDR